MLFLCIVADRRTAGRVGTGRRASCADVQTVRLADVFGGSARKDPESPAAAQARGAAGDAGRRVPGRRGKAREAKPAGPLPTVIEARQGGQTPHRSGCQGERPVPASGAA